jgi:hypothetical protein
MFGQILVKTINMELQENSSGGIRVIPYGRTDMVDIKFGSHFDEALNSWTY